MARMSIQLTFNNLGAACCRAFIGHLLAAAQKLVMVIYLSSLRFYISAADMLVVALVLITSPSCAIDGDGCSHELLMDHV